MKAASKREFDQTLKELRDINKSLRLLIETATSGETKTLLTKHVDSLEKGLAQILRGREYQDEFNLLRRTARLLAKAVDEEEVLKAILDGLYQTIPCDAAGIFLISEEEDGNTATVRAQEVRGYSINQHDNLQQKIDEGILGYTIKTSKGEIVDNVLDDERYIAVRPKTRSEMVSPIISKNEVIGCINLESDDFSAFEKANLTFLENLASLAAISLDQARTHRELVEAQKLEHELEIARGIQTKLLPKYSPVVKDYDFAGLNFPSQSIGGDYYDFMPTSPGNLGIVIADVAGKGVAAGLVMSGLRAALRARVETVYSIKNLIGEINSFLVESTGSERFVTAFYGVLNYELGQFTYVNAGHNYPFVLHPDDSIEWLETGGPLLGVIEDAEYQMATTTLRKGSILVMFTDGIVESGGQKGEEFGEERIIELVRSLMEAPAEVIAKTIEREAVVYNRSRRGLDDRTVIVVKRV